MKVLPSATAKQVTKQTLLTFTSDTAQPEAEQPTELCGTLQNKQHPSKELYL
jgi:hypothetical protein